MVFAGLRIITTKDTAISPEKNQIVDYDGAWNVWNGFLHPPDFFSSIRIHRDQVFVFCGEPAGAEDKVLVGNR